MSAPTTRGRVRVEQSQKRARVYLAGELVADSTRPVLVWESPYYPSYYLPAADVRAELVATGRTERSPRRGDAELYDVKVAAATRSEEHTSELQSRRDLVCRLLLEKK